MVQCPVCGREVEKLVEGLCPDCYRKEHEVLDVRDFRVLRCFSCGSIFVRGKWVRPRRGEGFKDLIARLLLDNVRISQGARIAGVNISFSEDRVVYEVRVVGSPHEGLEELEENYVLLVPLVNDLCTSCRSLYRRKEMGLVQVRGFPTNPAKSLLARVRSVIDYAKYKTMGKNIGEISDVEELEWGIDVRTTTDKLAKHIAYELHKAFPSRMVETQRVVGIDGSGRKVVRYTASVLLITAKRGDVLSVGGRQHLVADVKRKGVKLVDVEMGEERVVDVIKFTKMHVVYMGKAERGVVTRAAEGGTVVNVGGKPVEARSVGVLREGEEAFVVRSGDVVYALAL